jgi:DNA (cytosine-5)-methyltransferase 1
VIAGTMTTHGEHSGGWSNSIDKAAAGYMIPDVAWCLQERDAKGPDSDTKPGHLIPVAIAENQRGEVREMDQCPSLSVGGGKPGRGYPAIAFKAGQGAGARSLGLAEELSPTLPSSDSGSNRAPTVATMIHGTQDPCVSDIAFALGRNSGQENVYGVRRLTPRECERLQGFPDDYTLVEYRGKPASDGPRYKALGNSMATPVVSWLGARIAAANVLLPSAKSAVQNGEAAKTTTNTASLP